MCLCVCYMQQCIFVDASVCVCVCVGVLYMRAYLCVCTECTQCVYVLCVCKCVLCMCACFCVCVFLHVYVYTCAVCLSVWSFEICNQIQPDIEVCKPELSFAFSFTNNWKSCIQKNDKKPLAAQLFIHGFLKQIVKFTESPSCSLTDLETTPLVTKQSSLI